MSIFMCIIVCIAHRPNCEPDSPQSAMTIRGIRACAAGSRASFLCITILLLEIAPPFAQFLARAETLHHEFASRFGPGSEPPTVSRPNTISSTVNQQLIAERLKLSRTTVSRSLANHPAISADTRAQVQSLAAKMGYRGNPTRTLRRSRQSKPLTIGVLIGVPRRTWRWPRSRSSCRGSAIARAWSMSRSTCASRTPRSFEPAVRPQGIFRNIRAGDWRGTVLIYPFPEQTVAMIARKISAVAVLESYSTPGYRHD